MDERDTGKYPIKSKIPRYGMGYDYYDWICPTCGNFLAFEPDIDHISQRCQKCGQLLIKPEENNYGLR